MTTPSESARIRRETEGAAIQRILDFSTAIERGEEPWREGVQEISRIALEARRALADAPAGDGWQDISTAPKDGRWILGWAEDASPYRISWGRNHTGTLAWCTFFCSFVDGYITHWLPVDLPPPPAEKG